MTDNQQLQIMIIEDSRMQVELVRRHLTQALGTPFSLDNDEKLADGLQRMSESHFDVLLLDLHVLDSVGYDTFLTAKAAIKAPIVILSGDEDATVAERAVQDGAQGFLIKGEYTSEELARCIHLAIDAT